MEYKIKITNIQVDDTFDCSLYPESGFYMVNDTEFVLCDKQNNLIFYICNKHHVLNQLHLIEKQETTINGISEDLFLKTISLFKNKEESYKD